jgi:drug/metabolite transporter (DMT)-like permease
LKARLLVAFALVYVVWGSTYLGIRIAIETIPPFLMAGIRFTIAGSILMIWSRSRGNALPSRAEWKVAGVIGVLLMLLGNGGVVWAEQTVPSSLAALIVASSPIVTVAIDWLRPGGPRPSNLTIAGLLIGFAGVAILVNPFATDVARVDPKGAAAVLVAVLAWSAGSIYSRSRPYSTSALMGAAANMVTGGLMFLVVGLATGELPRLDLHATSARSAIALLYLIFVGALVGFTAFFYILQHTTPAKSTTYAYVNPVVAIILGWAVLDEPITPRVLLAAAIIISGVVTITALPHLLKRSTVDS